MHVEAFLFEPSVPRNVGVVVLHQHNSQWHIGKSEVAGTMGDPFQAFGPALAQLGFTVLAPDALGFESRRAAATQRADSEAMAPDGSTREDWLQFYNHAMHRIVRGELLMSRVVMDVASALAALRVLAPCAKVGLLGHSYGGMGALFAGALLDDVSFVVSSGALCSYRYKLEHGVGLDMSLVIPGFAKRLDLDDLLRCIAPRPALIVSSDEDPFSADAEELVARVQPCFEDDAGRSNLHRIRSAGTHALDASRFESIVDWVHRQAG
jgi:pimeloyl-ACP methyl ester carboxylesterase